MVHEAFMVVPRSRGAPFLLLTCELGGVVEEMKSVGVTARESGVAACSTRPVGASLSRDAR
jgi:hypothetical protein